MGVPDDSEVTLEVCPHLAGHPGLTDYQLNRHIMSVHGPEVLQEVRSALIRLGLAAARVDTQGWQRWHVTPAGEAASAARQR